MTFSEWYLFRVLSVCALVAIVVAPPLSSSAQVSALVTLVFILGVPHGAFDPFIAKQRRVWSTFAGLIAFSLIYFLAALFVAIFWYFAPVICLVLFLIISAWHFGADWTLHPLARLFMGIFVIGLPSVFHGKDVAEVFSVLSGDQTSWIVQLLSFASLMSAGLILSLLLIKGRPVLSDKAFDVALLVASSAVFSPIVFFILYFCALHSPMHIRQTLSSLEERERRQALKFALVFSILTIILAAAAFIGVRLSSSADEAALRIVFVGLAALTVPHLILIDGYHLPQTGGRN